MTIATKINDIIALSQSSHDTQFSALLSEEELCLVFGGSGGGGGGGGGGGSWAASDAAFADQQAAQERFDNAVQNGLEALGNLEMGSATRHANEAYNAYGDVQTATQNLYNAVDNDSSHADTQQQIDQQIANGHDYSPMDANMSNHDGSPGVGGSY
jgi:hypothetical protein